MGVLVWVLLLLLLLLTFFLFQAHQRLPSYEEALVHRNQIPDLLQDEPSFRQDHGEDVALVKKGSTSEQVSSLEKSGSFGREKGALNRVSRASSHSSHHSYSPASSSLERESSQQQSDSPNRSPLSSLEWSTEGTGEYVRQHSHRSSPRSTHSSPRVQQTLQSPISPDTREAVWERLYEEGASIPLNSKQQQQQRLLERRSTVASSAPSNFVTTDLLSNGSIPNGSDGNIAELIDPTFNRRRSQNVDESSPANTLAETEAKPKGMPLIQPHRRRSTDKKKKDKEKECKQQ